MSASAARVHDDSLCTVCHESTEYFAIGHCDHPICVRCSTKMRILCDQMYCAICRSDLPKVLFIKKLDKFENIKLNSFCINREKKIFFEDEELQHLYKKLLENRCRICKEDFRKFEHLEVHMRRVHNMHYCELCIQNLKLFSHDRKFYDRKELAEHKRIGDQNDTSYRCHPLCQFCDMRYFDNDDLLRHLRKDHYFCHFCEANGINNEYFEEYKYLKDHFRDSHFLCEEDGCCQIEFVNAFSSEIDLKAHISTNHGKNFGKQQARQMRTIDIDVNYGPRPNANAGRRNDGRFRGGASGSSSSSYGERNPGRPMRYGGPDQRKEQQQQKMRDVDAAFALSVSLADVQRQGHVSVMDQQLAQNSHLGGHHQDQDSRPEKEKFTAASDDFPTLRGEKKESGSNLKRSEQNGGKSCEASKSNAGTLAQVLAFTAGRSYQDGQLQDKDFPSLTTETDGKQNGYRVKGQVWNEGGKTTAYSPTLAAKHLQRTKGGVMESKRAESQSQIWQKGTLGATSRIGELQKAETNSIHRSRTAPSLTDFPELGGSSSSTEVSGVWLPKKSTQADRKTSKEETKGPTKLEIKNKGKERRDDDLTINRKQTKLDFGNSSDKENGRAESRGAKDEPTNVRAAWEPAKSLADLASKLTSNCKDGKENTEKYKSNEKEKEKEKDGSQESKNNSKKGNKVFDLTTDQSNAKSERKNGSKPKNVGPESRLTIGASENEIGASCGAASSSDQPNSKSRKMEVVENLRSREEKQSKTTTTYVFENSKYKREKESKKTDSKSKNNEAASSGKTNVCEASEDKVSKKITSKPKEEKKSNEGVLSKGGSTLQDKQQTNKSDSLRSRTTEKTKEFAEKESSKYANVGNDSKKINVRDSELRRAKEKANNADAFSSVNDKEILVGRADFKIAKNVEEKLVREEKNEAVHSRSDYFHDLTAFKDLTNDEGITFHVPKGSRSEGNDVVIHGLAAETRFDLTNLDIQNSLLCAPPVSLLTALTSENLDSKPLFVPNDFPNLVTSASAAQPRAPPPPGFQNSSSKPPPGFASIATTTAGKPPPGFSKPALNGFAATAAASSDITDIFMVIPCEEKKEEAEKKGSSSDKPMTYIPPKLSQERYAKLVEGILSEHSESTFADFKTLSVEFRRGLIGGREYYDRCADVLGSSAFQRIFPKLVALLPNIEKQQELLAAHRSRAAEETPDVAGWCGKMRKPWSGAALDGDLLSCTFCGQVIVGDDYDDHLVQHDSLDFPALR